MPLASARAPSPSVAATVEVPSVSEQVVDLTVGGALLGTVDVDLAAHDTNHRTGSGRPLPRHRIGQQTAVRA
jgi:hypothetical protein